MSLEQIQDEYPFFEDGTRIRPAAGSMVDGYWTAGGAPVSTPIRVSIQAVESHDRAEAEEGQHQRGDVALLCDTELQAGSKDGAIQPDIVEVQGTQYVIKTVERWKGFDTLFWDTTAVLKQ